jgi:hypothetical protein
MDKEELLPLEGSAGGNLWKFFADHGPIPNPINHTFPLMTHDEFGEWQLIGTGFYISPDGLFVTAKHVIEDVFEQDKQIKPLAIFHAYFHNGFFGQFDYSIRPVMQCWVGEKADIALGVAANGHHKKTGEFQTNFHWCISWNKPSINDRICLYAYPNHKITKSDNRQNCIFSPDFYEGLVEEVADFRDKVFCPYPYLQSTIHSHSAASGGPLINNNGRIIGVNCRWLKPDGPESGIQIRCLQDAFLYDMVLDGDEAPRKVTFNELVLRGIIPVESYSTSAIIYQPGKVVRLDSIPITAESPTLQNNIYM